MRFIPVATCLLGLSSPLWALPTSPAPLNDEQTKALEASHAASLMGHLPFVAERERWQTPADPLARVPELRAPSEAPTRDLFSDTWVATDELGRAVSLRGAARAPQPNKTVGVFYYINMPNDRGPVQDMAKMLLESPKNPKWGNRGTTYWWGEPDVGYRRSNDLWVLRRDLALLSEAGVDVLMFDTTNANTYSETYFNLCRVARWMRSQGQKTPQIAFVTNNRMSERVMTLWNEFYSRGLYSELWYRWNGKPIIFAKKDALDPDDNAPLPQEVQDFFTWRFSWAWNPARGHWPWLERYPQKGGLNPDTGELEEVAVASASHPTNNTGKSFSNGNEPPLDEQDQTPLTGSGPFFAEQWRGALKLDPPFVWVTQWNEWASVSPVAGPNGQGFLDRRVSAGQQFLVDTYNPEFNRDLSPMKGGWGDNYYLQLVDGIRRFKGARPLPVATGQQPRVRLDQFTDWNAVAIEFRDAQGDTLHRDWPGHGGNYYKNDSGRNDIITAKVALDPRNASFWVESAAHLTPPTDPLWMQLLINADGNYTTGWKGFDFAVSNYDPQTGTATLSHLSDTGTLSATGVKVPFRAQGNHLALAIPRASLGLTDKTAATFDFHWTDNAPIGADIHDFYLLGDSAPDGRFNYRYTWAK